MKLTVWRVLVVLNTYTLFLGKVVFITFPSCGFYFFAPLTFLPSVISSFFNQNKGGPGPHSLDSPLHKHSMITLLKLASPVKAVWFFRLCQNFSSLKNNWKLTCQSSSVTGRKADTNSCFRSAHDEKWICVSRTTLLSYIKSLPESCNENLKAQRKRYHGG